MAILDHRRLTRRGRNLQGLAAVVATGALVFAAATAAAAAPVGVPVTDPGTIEAWGYGASGLTNAPPGSNYTAIAAGWSHSLALTDDGAIKTWGEDNAELLNNVPPGNGYKAIAASTSHSFALTHDGAIKVWGSPWGHLLDAPGGSGYTAIAAGALHSLALTADGTIRTWGQVSDQLAAVPPGNGYKAIAAGSYHSLALTADGTIRTWGQVSDELAAVPPSSGYKAIAAGGNHSLALTADGTIKAWGSNTSGQTTVPPGNGYIAIAAGWGHSLALTADGIITTWGSSYGLTDAPKSSGYTALAAGTNHSVALKKVTAPTFAAATPSIVDGVVGTAMTYTFVTTGNPAPAFTTTGLPAGLALDPTTGVLTGTPTTTGSFPVTITATNHLGTATRDITLDVAAALESPLFTDTGAVQVNGVVGTELTREFAAKGNPTPVVSVIDPSQLPEGMTFTHGTLRGTPTTAGTYNFTLKASNSVDPDVTLDVTVNVTGAESPVINPFGSLEYFFGFTS